MKRSQYSSTSISLAFGLFIACSASTRTEAQVVTTNYTGAFHPASAPAGDTSQGVFNAFTNFIVSNGTTSAKWDLNITPIASGQKPVYLQDPVQSGSQVNYINTLDAAFPTWTFNYVSDPANDLANNSLIVRTYSVLKDGADPNPGIGADFAVQYNPAAGANNPPSAETHWIQVITTNWKLGSAPPTTDTKVDNLGAAVPYYDANGAATSTDFWDAPERDPTNPANALWNGTSGFKGVVTWTAEDYLVQETNADNGSGGRDVTVWDGVRYGFTASLATPEPGTWMFAVVCTGAGFLSLRRKGSSRRTRA